jgi:hypothetical protein
MDTALLELLQLVKEMSPVVWEAAYKQNLMFGIGNLLMGTIILMLAIWAVIWLGTLYKANNKYRLEVSSWEGTDWKERQHITRPASPAIVKHKDEITEYMAWGMASFFSVWGGLVLFYGIMYLTNPVYWTIHLLLNNAS